MSCPWDGTTFMNYYRGSWNKRQSHLYRWQNYLFPAYRYMQSRICLCASSRRSKYICRTKVSSSILYAFAPFIRRELLAMIASTTTTTITTNRRVMVNLMCDIDYWLALYLKEAAKIMANALFWFPITSWHLPNLESRCFPTNSRPAFSDK